MSSARSRKVDSGRILELDGLRGIAVLLLDWHYAGDLVDSSLDSFYVRRALRISSA